MRLQSGASAETRFGGTNRGALLGYLASAPAEPQPRDTVAAALWPDSDADSNRHRLRQELSALRRQLESAGLESESLLIATRNEVQLNPELTEVDVRVYRETARRARRMDDVERRTDLLAEAAALYTGPFLAEYDHEWVRLTRDRLAADQKRILEELASLHKEQGDMSGALDWLRSLLFLDPLDESAHIAIMRLHVDADQPAQAVQQYRDLERLLRTELEVAPSREAREIIESVREMRPAPSFQLATHISPSTPPIGNEAESVLNAREDAPPRDYRSVPNRTSISERKRPARHPSRTPSRLMAVGTALLAVGLVAVWLGWHRRSSNTLRKDSGAPQVLPTLWQKSYAPSPGERADSEPTSLSCFHSPSQNDLYLCGFTQTDKEDVDILTQRYAEADGALLWSKRYSSPEHDADRAYAAIADGNGVCVVGETYVPSGHGVKEGWRHIALRYDRNGKRQWAVRHPDLIWEGDVRQIAGSTDGAEGALIGGTIVRNGVKLAMVSRVDRYGVLLWTTILRPEGTINSQLRDVVGNEHGYYASGRAELPPSPNGPSSIGFVAALAPSDGHVQWTRTLDGGHHGGNVVERLAMPGTVGVYAGCNVYSGDPASGGNGQILGVAFFGADGKREWFHQLDRTGPAFSLRAMRCHYSGSLLLSGVRNAPDNGGESLTACYDLSGNLRWDRQSPLPKKKNGSPFALTNRDEHVFTLVGLYPGPLTASQDAWQVEEYTMRGEPLSRTMHAGPLESFDRPRSIVATGSGVIVASQTGPGKIHEITLTKYRFQP